jgi:ABC-type transport system involved in multi-copper enzyme maturation permease subunit
MTSPTTAINRLGSTSWGRVTQPRVALSEWTKLRSLRSTVYTLLVTAIVTIGFGAIASAVTASRWPSMAPADKAEFDPLSTSLVGVNFGVLAIGVLGVLLITGEYSTGMIRSTFAAVPKRLPVLWAKAGVYSLVALAVALPSTLIAFFAGQAFLSSQHIQISFSHSGVPGAVIGSALYLTLVGLLGLGLGGILRNTAAGIAAFAGIMFVIPPLVSILPASIANAIDPYLPSNAGSAIMTIGHQAHVLAPWAGMAVFAGYAAVAIAVAAITLRRRDV